MNLETLTPAPPRDGSRVTDSQNSPEQFHVRRILVADDDECIRHLLSTALTSDGFDVNAAADGGQAWEALHRDHYDLLVTDNEMPRLKGIELIERMREAGMNLPIIIASGSLSTERVSEYPQLQIAAVLLKPFGIPELLDTVRDVLASSGGARADHAAFQLRHASPQPIR